MIPVSKHVHDVIELSPFLGEALSERIANLSAVASHIHADVEKRAREKVSKQSIVMALSRLTRRKNKVAYGLRFLKHMEDISVRTGNTLVIARTEDGGHIESVFKQKKTTYFSKVSGSFETLYVCLPNTIFDFHIFERATVHHHVTALTLTLPKASLSVPGVYYPILKKLSWNGVNIIELVSVGQELTFYVEKKDTERAFVLLNSLRD